MAENPGAGSRKVGAVILLIVAAANFGYAGYRFLQDGEIPLPLVIGGSVCGALAAVFLGGLAGPKKG